MTPSIENNTALKKTNAKFIKTRNEARRSSWVKKTASLNMETDCNKLWRLTKQLNDEENRNAKITQGTIYHLSYEELSSALSNLKLKKSPGPDAITNEMIVNL